MDYYVVKQAQEGKAIVLNFHEYKDNMQMYYFLPRRALSIFRPAGGLAAAVPGVPPRVIPPPVAPANGPGCCVCVPGITPSWVVVGAGVEPANPPAAGCGCPDGGPATHLRLCQPCSALVTMELQAT